MEAYIQGMNAKRRQSLKQRNEEAKQQRDEEEKNRTRAATLEHESYELKWDGERDRQKYIQELEQERRESLKCRNLEARQQRNRAKAQTAADLEAKHESFELKRAASKDVDEYRRVEDQNRRNSLKFRNQEKARHAKVMEELGSIAKEQETESYLLKWNGEDDAKKYLAELAQERRNSIRRRNEEARRHRELDDESYRQELARKHEDEELKAAGKFPQRRSYCD